jgi:formiminoglutamase
MKDLSIYFSPTERNWNEVKGSIGEHITAYDGDYFPDIAKDAIVIFHVPEFRGNDKLSEDRAARFNFREAFYRLSYGVGWNKSLIDLGDVLPGKTLEDTYFAVGQITAELIKNGCIPLVIGGGQDLTLAMYKGYEQLEQTVNLCTIDYTYDLGSPDSPVTAAGYLSTLLVQRPCYLFNHAVIGVQAPFLNADEQELFDKLYFDACRLGEFNADFKRAEPHLRNADILSLDIESVKYSELLDGDSCNPNGFTAQQICQLAKYAGVSDKLTSFGVFNYQGKSILSSKLIAEILWYFIDGVSQRKGDFPIGSKKSYSRFTVHLDDFKDEVVFYKSDKSNRWWMEVPYPGTENSYYERHHMVPCDHEDYERAMRNELPDLWWKTYQKISV